MKNIKLFINEKYGSIFVRERKEEESREDYIDFVAKKMMRQALPTEVKNPTEKEISNFMTEHLDEFRGYADEAIYQAENPLDMDAFAEICLDDELTPDPEKIVENAMMGALESDTKVNTEELSETTEVQVAEEEKPKEEPKSEDPLGKKGITLEDFHPFRKKEKEKDKDKTDTEVRPINGLNPKKPKGTLSSGIGNILGKLSNTQAKPTQVKPAASKTKQDTKPIPSLALFGNAQRLEEQLRKAEEDYEKLDAAVAKRVERLQEVTKENESLKEQVEKTQQLEAELAAKKEIEAKREQDLKEKEAELERVNAELEEIKREKEDALADVQSQLELERLMKKSDVETALAQKNAELEKIKQEKEDALKEAQAKIEQEKRAKNTKAKEMIKENTASVEAKVLELILKYGSVEAYQKAKERRAYLKRFMACRKAGVIPEPLYPTPVEILTNPISSDTARTDAQNAIWNKALKKFSSIGTYKADTLNIFGIQGHISYSSESIALKNGMVAVYKEQFKNLVDSKYRLEKRMWMGDTFDEEEEKFYQEEIRKNVSSSIVSVYTDKRCKMPRKIVLVTEQYYNQLDTINKAYVEYIQEQKKIKQESRKERAKIQERQRNDIQTRLERARLELQKIKEETNLTLQQAEEQYRAMVQKAIEQQSISIQEVSRHTKSMIQDTESLTKELMSNLEKKQLKALNTLEIQQQEVLKKVK